MSNIALPEIDQSTINKKGKEIGRFDGPLEWDSKEVKDYLTKLKELNN